MSKLSERARFAAAAVVGFLASAPLNAQPCEPFWREVPGIDDVVYALTMWDPDGPGPRDLVLVVGGRFTEAGGLSANHIATWDPATGEWAALGDGVNSWVRSLITLPNGDLVAGGHFSVAGGEEAHKIARWDGERWHAMGRGLPGGWGGFERPAPGVYALTITPWGELLAGGDFFLAAGDPTAGQRLALWNGDAWRPLEPPIPFWAVPQALHFVDGGDLIVGGYFDEGIARWDGVEWNSMGQGLPPGAFGFGGPFALASGPSGELIAGGLYYVDLGAGLSGHGVAQWDGAEWGPLGEGDPGVVFAMLPRPDGSVIVTGGFVTAGGKPARVARWDGEEWWPLPGAAGGGNALVELPSGDIAIGHGGRLGLSIWGCRDCYADCDGDGELTFFDFLCFQNLFAAADPAADCDGDTEFTFFDFLCFQNEFIKGCP